MACLALATDLHSGLASQLTGTGLKAQHRFRPIEGGKHRVAYRHPSSLRIVAQISSPSSTPDATEKPYTSGAGAVKEVPGSYGLPYLGVALDRLKYFVLQGRDEFFLSLMRRYNSTVIRVNMPPGPPLYPDSRIIMLLDQKSIRVLFDTSKVEKKDVFAGTYIPSTDYTGGFRVLPYLDPSEPKHTLLKEFCFEMLKSNGPKFLPEFHTAFLKAATEWDAEMDQRGAAEFTKSTQNFTLNFLCSAIVDADPSAPGPASLGDKGPTMIEAWVAGQLAPQAVLYTIPIPFWLVSSQYNKLYQFFRTHGQRMLDVAESKFGLDREEACHNLLFFVCFNTWGGFLFLLPSIMKRISAEGEAFQKELAQDVRSAVGAEGKITMKALEDMKLVHSTVYEVLRIDPPVPFQYGRAKSDMIIESHDAAYRVRKGELLGGYQKIAMTDPKVFKAPQTFMPKRFMGTEGEELLQSLTWSNGPESVEPAVSNKQCAGKNFVSFVARLMIAELFLRYDFFEVEAGKGLQALDFKVLKKRSS